MFIGYTYVQFIIIVIYTFNVGNCLKPFVSNAYFMDSKASVHIQTMVSLCLVALQLRSMCKVPMEKKSNKVGYYGKVR